jgi:hypothetical protein
MTKRSQNWSELIGRRREVVRTDRKVTDVGVLGRLVDAGWVRVLGGLAGGGMSGDAGEAGKASWCRGG